MKFTTAFQPWSSKDSSLFFSLNKYPDCSTLVALSSKKDFLASDSCDKTVKVCYGNDSYSVRSLEITTGTTKVKMLISSTVRP